MVRKGTKRGGARKAPQAKASADIVLRTNIPQPKTNRPRGQGRRSTRRRRRGRFPNLQDFFTKALMYPDLMGPIRVPRPMTGARTALGRDRTIVMLSNVTADVTVCAVQMGTGYAPLAAGSIIASYKSSSQSVAMTRDTTIYSPGTQNPPQSSVYDACLVSGCVTVSILGTVTNITGQLLIGSGPPLTDDNTVSWANLIYYPGAQYIPAVELLKGPVRCCLRHLSPASWAFRDNVAGETGIDYDTPFVVCTGLPTGVVLRVEFTRNWEVRSKIGFGALPYEAASNSMTKDTNAFEDAVSYVSSKVVSITEMVPDEIKDVAKDIAVEAGLSALSGAASQFGVGVSPESMMNAIHNYHQQRLETTNSQAIRFKDEL